MRLETAALFSLLAQLVQRALGDDEPAPHDGNAVGHQLRLAQHMSRDDESRAAFFLLAEVAAHVRRGHRVQAGGRFVAEDPVGLVDGRADQGYLLRHATRVRGQDGVGAVSQLETLEKARDALAADLFRDAVQVAKAVEVLSRRVASVQARLVRHHTEPPSHQVQAFGQAVAVELDEAGVGPQYPTEASERRRFTRAVLPEQDEDLTALGLKIHPGHCAHVAKALVQTLDSDHGKPQLR